MTAVWNADLDRTAKYVLLCMADHADDEGKNVRPSLGLLAWKCQYDERQVRRIIRDLEAVGILARANNGTGGRAKTTEYQIVFEKLPVRPAFGEQNPDIVTSGFTAQEAVGAPEVKADTTMSGYQNPDILETRTFPTQNPDILDEYPDILNTNPDIAMSPESIELIEPIEPLVGTKPKKNPARLSSTPESFEVTEALYGWAFEKFGFGRGEVDSETEKFLDFHRARGSKMLDWVAAWRTWFRKAVEFRDERVRNQGFRERSKKSITERNMENNMRAREILARMEQQQAAANEFEAKGVVIR